ncbi:MAG: transcriptional regulator [bacterium]|nr:transcriptional regulator [bacterium]
MNTPLEMALSHWSEVSPILTPPHSEEAYDRTVEAMEALLEMVDDNPDHPLYGLLDTLSLFVETYDREHYQLPKAAPNEVLDFLMKEHNMTQKQLESLGFDKQSNISNILKGKVQMNTRHIKVACEVFHVGAGAFI